jgi:UDP-N-acetyl-D-mannosaminuronic acid dehydrogenase
MFATDQNQKRHNQQYQNILSRFNKILLIGLGKLGLPLAKYVKERGCDTYGYDSSAEIIAEIKQAVDFGSVDFDVFMISVSIHQPDDIFSPQIDRLLCIVDKISKEAKIDRTPLSLESTIQKGTSKKVFEILNHRFRVVHSPHRWYSLDEKEHGVNQLRVIGGVCDCCLEPGIQFYGVTEEETYFDTTPNSYNSLGIPMHPASNVEIAEITKIGQQIF